MGFEEKGGGGLPILSGSSLGEREGEREERVLLLLLWDLCCGGPQQYLNFPPDMPLLDGKLPEERDFRQVTSGKEGGRGGRYACNNGTSYSLREIFLRYSLMSAMSRE